MKLHSTKNRPNCLRKGKYHCTNDLKFPSSCIKLMLKFSLFEISVIQSSRTGGQLYSNTSPL